MKQLTEFNEEKRFSSLFICDEINKFRDLEGNRSKLRHSDLLAKIEKEFEEEIHQRKISLQFNIRQLPNKGTVQDKYYELTYEQSLQLLMGEFEQEFTETKIRPISYTDSITKIAALNFQATSYTDKWNRQKKCTNLHTNNHFKF